MTVITQLLLKIKILKLISDRIKNLKTILKTVCFNKSP